MTLSLLAVLAAEPKPRLWEYPVAHPYFRHDRHNRSNSYHHLALGWDWADRSDWADFELDTGCASKENLTY